MEWKVGELASATGLTVRTLHHYDEIGLLRPSARTEGGHRLYRDADVRRLYRIVALRGLGVPLGQIGPLLDGSPGGGAALVATVREQIARLDEQVSRARELRGRLERLLAAAEAGPGGADGPSAADLIETLEAMTMYERYYTQEQLSDLAARGEALGPEGMRAARDAWQEVADGLAAARDAGTDPADPSVQALIDRSDELIAQFTGGDEGIRRSLDELHAAEGAPAATHGMWDDGLAEYTARARAVRGR